MKDNGLDLEDDLGAPRRTVPTGADEGVSKSKLNYPPAGRPPREVEVDGCHVSFRVPESSRGQRRATGLRDTSASKLTVPREPNGPAQGRS